MTSMIASRLPGRIRLRDRALRDHLLRERLQAELAGWDGMVAVEANPSVGSLLLQYDPSRVGPAAMEARVAALVDAVGERPAPNDPDPAAEPSAAVARVLALRRLNRYAKFGMLGSLALSLAALAGNKRLHAVAGGVSVATTLVHMAVHRRHMLK